jgi:PAS domain S-box-containing protein
MDVESSPDDCSETLALFGAGGGPLTTDEVAERLDVDRPSAVDRLERLTGRGHLAVRTVDPDTRVWWRPSTGTDGTGSDERRPTSTVETVLERITDGVYELDEELRFTYVNDRAEHLLGVEESSVAGTDIREEVPLTEPFEDALETALRDQEPVVMEDYYEPLEAWFENRIYPSETGLSVYFRDVSERKRREQELEERTHELRDQNERLDRFTAILSHDLRNPLAVARGRVSLLDVGDDQQEHVEAINSAHDRIEALIDDVLSLAREGSPADDPAPVSLTRVATNAWGHLNTGGATLEIDTDREIDADESRLQQLFENLFRNAVKHGSETSRPYPSGHGGEYGSTAGRPGTDDGTDLDASDVTVRVGDLADGSGFYVEDDGPGISPSERERVFEYGYSAVEEGTGLGLAIVRQIAEARGWTVTATEATGGGARFEIRGC